MVPEADKPTPLYAQFDGDEIDGKRYAIGEEIDLDRHTPGTLTYLSGLGRLGGSKPTEGVIIDTTVPVSAMNRAQLLAELSVHHADDDLREAVQAKRDHEAGQAADARGEPVKGEDDKGDSVLDQSIPKLTASLDTIDDPARLATLREVEAKGKNRDGALAAIDARIAALNPPKLDYERDGLKDIDLATADRDQLLAIATHEGAEDFDADATDDDLREAISAKRSA